MTAKKAAVWCIGLGTALALFGAAVGLNRPSDTVAPGHASLLRPDIQAANEAKQANRVTDDAPVRQHGQSAQATAARASTPAQSLLGNQAATPAQGEQRPQLPVTVVQNGVVLNPQLSGTPEARSSSELPHGGRALSLQDVNIMRGVTSGVVSTVSSGAARIVSRSGGVVVAEPNFHAGEGPETVTPPCAVSTTQDAAAGEDIYHEDGNASATLVFALDGGYGGTSSFLNNEIQLGSLDDATLASPVPGATTVNITGVGLFYATNNPDLHRITVKIRQPGMGLNCANNATSQPAVLNETFCTRGSVLGDPNLIEIIYANFKFAAPVSVPLGTCAIDLSIQSSFAEPIDPNTQAFGFILAGPGNDDADGTITNSNGNTDCVGIYSQNFFAGGLGFTGAYSGYHVRLHTTDYINNKNSTTGGNETAPTACDIDNGDADTNQCETPGNGALDAGDSNTLAFLINANFNLTINDPGFSAVKCADVDRNGLIDCNDWNSYVAICAPVASPPGTMTTRGCVDTIRDFTSGGALAAPPGETAATLPIDIPDNNPFGRTNTQNVAVTPPNGISDIDVDVRIDHTFNSDLVVALAHSGVTQTLVDQPLPRNGGVGFSGERILLDDGEADGSGGPGGGLTLPVEFARSEFRVFGRYKPNNPLSAYVGRIFGGGTNVTGTGSGDYRLIVSDRFIGDSGTLTQWSLHVKLGTPVVGIVKEGVDQFRNLGCRTVDTAGATWFRFGSGDAGNPIPAIPAGFFDTTSTATSGAVSFEGEPIASATSDADMVTTRPASGGDPWPVDLTSPDHTAELRIVSVSLRSCQPIPVTYSDRPWGDMWNCAVTLDPLFQVTPGGSMTLYNNGAPDTSADGRYWASLRLVPTFVFTKACDPTMIKRWGPNEATVLNAQLDMELGDEVNGSANPPCNTGSFPCRSVYVNDPNLGSNALGANPNAIVPGDKNFVPGVSASPAFAKVEATMRARVESPPLSGTYVIRNWFAIGYRPAMRIPMCGSPPSNQKPLPCDMVCGTWGLAPAFLDVLPLTSGGNQAGPPTNAAGGAFTSELRIEVAVAALDQFTLTANSDIVRAFYWGGYQCTDQDGGGPLPANAVPAGFIDAFQIKFWPDRGVTPSEPDLTGGAIVNITQGSFTSIARIDTGLTITLGIGTLRIYRYEVDFPAVSLTGLPTTKYWFEVANDCSATSPPLTGIATIQGRWLWFNLAAVGIGDGNNVAGFRFTNGNIFSAGSNNLAYQLFRQIPQTRAYCGDSVANSCVPAPTGLSYKFNGVADGRGSLEINGKETKSSTPFFFNRWNSVVALVKPGLTNKYREDLTVAGLPANDPSVLTKLNVLLGTKAPGLSCETGQLITTLGASVVDRVFAAKVGYDDPNGVTGTITQICRQPDGQDYPGGTIDAGFLLKNNLDVFGIGLPTTLVTTNPYALGRCLYWVMYQNKDCNGNTIDDADEIASGAAQDCNSNGIPDLCEVPSICPTCPDCNSNQIPDECEPDCNTNGIIDPCDVVGHGGTFADCDTNLQPDICQSDCDNNGTIDPCQVAGNPLLDCNSNRIPDTCETQGVFVAAPNINNPGFATIVNGAIDFNAPNYNVGLLDPGNLPEPTPGQQGWDLVFGDKFQIIGPPRLSPTTGGQITQTLPSAFVCSGFSGRWLYLTKDAAAGSSTFWSYGYQSPKMNNAVAGLTRIEGTFRADSGETVNDRESCWLVDNSGANLIWGLRLRKINATDTGIGIWTFSDQGIVTFGDQVPFNTCVRFRVELDDINTQNATPINLFLDTTGTGSSFTLVRTDGPAGDRPLRPTKISIGTGDTAASAANPIGCEWDNLAFFVATPFDPLLATCSGSTKNGCRLQPIGAELDCNWNHVPDLCDIACTGGSTFAPVSLPITSTTQPTTQPCSTDCNSNNIPDECEVGVQQTINRMFHTMETVATPPPPNFQFPASVIGQPTTDPLADGAPGWTITSALVPTGLSAQVSAAAFCPVVGGNERSIGLFVDPALPTDSSGAWALTSGTYGLGDDVAHLSRQTYYSDILIQPGKSTLRIELAGDTFVVAEVSFRRAGLNYTNDFDSALQSKGFLQQNEVQVGFALTTTGAIAFTPIPGATWAENACMRICVRTDLCSSSTTGGFDNRGSNVLIGLDRSSPPDGDFVDAGEGSILVGDYGSTNMRTVSLVYNNQISPNPFTMPGGIFVDNVRIDESDDYCDTPACTAADANTNGIPDSCEIPACATCQGDVNGDNAVRGNDIQGFVRCLINGPAITAGCQCADLNGSGTITTADIGTFIAELLGRNPPGDSNPTCP
ncbi:MAG: hypothetical protein U1A27_02440 [Phycisphaerae bacterium]